jgi:hypothetical protein
MSEEEKRLERRKRRERGEPAPPPISPEDDMQDPPPEEMITDSIDLVDTPTNTTVEITPMTAEERDQQEILDVIARIDVELYDEWSGKRLTPADIAPPTPNETDTKPIETVLIEDDDEDELGKYEEMTEGPNRGEEQPPTPVQDERNDCDSLLDGDDSSNPDPDILDSDDDVMDQNEWFHRMMPPPSVIVMPNVQFPPPALPRGLGSILFPRDTLQPDPRVPLSTYLREVSERRLDEEAAALRSTRTENPDEMRARFGANPRYCGTCTETRFRTLQSERTFHRHTSDLLHRARYRAEIGLNANGEYYCQNCKISHSALTGTRYPLILSSSILANWRRPIRDEPDYRGDEIHVDGIYIPGASYQTLRRAFLAEYGASTIPIDAVVCCGLNDVASGASLNHIIRDLHQLRQDILSIPGSTFGICSLPYPPSMTIIAEEVAGPRHVDRLPTLSQLNDEINRLNHLQPPGDNVHYAPSFQTWGTRYVRTHTQHPRNLREGAVGHRGRDWREQRPGDQLHLTDLVRRRMGKAIIRYMLAIYQIQPREA